MTVSLVGLNSNKKPKPKYSKSCTTPSAQLKLMLKQQLERQLISSSSLSSTSSVSSSLTEQMSLIPSTNSGGYRNDYSNNYIHGAKLPHRFLRNTALQVEGYPKLQRLYKLKEAQVAKHATKPYGCRVGMEDLTTKLHSWISIGIQFDVIMIGALCENQLIYPLLAQLPIDKLCARPGFLFIWASTQKISELSRLLNDQSTWTRRFRRSEELVFIPVDKNSPYYPTDTNIPESQLLEEIQWHCWMCITGTVRRSTDEELIHCNVNTDLSIENIVTGNSAVPSQIYKVVENFSSSTRRLHIIPTSTGLKQPVKVRPGWVIASPDVILDNFDPQRYKDDLQLVGNRVPLSDEIEQLRPKTPS